MQIVNVRQGSPEWKKLRLGRLCASEATAILGLSKYKTREQLLREKSTGLIPEVDAPTQARFNAGHAAEAAARSIVEAILGTELFPATGTVDIDGLPLLASFDGVNMSEDVPWENKLANSSNGGDLAALIDAEHWPQLEAQMLVANAKRIYFTVSDGTEKGTHGIWYESRPARRAQLLAAWKQFREDLNDYRHVEEKPVATGHAPETLPALRIEVTGMVTASNLTEFRQTALSVIGAINTNLETDEDFATAERTVKWCGDVEDRLDAAKQHALSQTTTIDALFRTIDEIKAEARTKRLNLDKLIKNRKEAIRGEIVREAQGILQSHVAALNVRLGRPYMPAQDMMRFAACIKGLKTVSSLRDAVNTELANAKVAASADADKIEANLHTLRDLASEHAFLFHDAAQIVLKATDDLTALVKTRIAEHKAAEEKRLEIERQRIRQEEEARANKAAEDKRLADERLRQEQAQVISPAVVTALTSPVIPLEAIIIPKMAVVPPAAASLTDKELEAASIDAYLITVKEPPKKKAEIKKHILAFLEFCKETS
jgi:predicted phage-related endonuclease